MSDIMLLGVLRMPFDPALDFEGPSNFEIPCDCTIDKSFEERMQPVMASQGSSWG